MDKIWLKNYPPGMPAEVDCAAFASLSDVLQNELSGAIGPLPAFSNMGKTITYRRARPRQRAIRRLPAERRG